MNFPLRRDQEYGHDNPEDGALDLACARLPLPTSATPNASPSGIVDTCASAPPSAGEGIWGRVLLVPWSEFIPPERRDLQLAAKLKQEGSGILNCLLNGLALYLDKGLVIPPEISSATEQYPSDSDPLGRFLDACTDQATRLADLGFDAAKVGLVGQGYASLSEPSKTLEKLVYAERLDHAGHPVLRWMADNVAVSTDPAGNIKPIKQASAEKIDGIAALLDALFVRLNGEDAPPSFEEALASIGTVTV